MYDEVRAARANQVDGDQADVYVDEFGYADGLLDDDQDRDQADASWSEAFRVEQMLSELRATFEARARPYLATQRRNPGRKLPQLVALETEFGKLQDEILRKHQRAAALDRAARRHPATVATAHERALEQAAARSFARDRYGSRHAGRAEPEPAGRPTSGLADW